MSRMSRHLLFTFGFVAVLTVVAAQTTPPQAADVPKESKNDKFNEKAGKTATVTFTKLANEKQRNDPRPNEIQLHSQLRTRPERSNAIIPLGKTLSLTTRKLSDTADDSFEAISALQVPPDTNGCVGIDHVMTALNPEIRVQKKDGSQLVAVSNQTFWAAVSTGDFPFDPKILFDPFEQRWVLVNLGSNAQKSSSLLIGVSKTADPAGDWHVHRIETDPDKNYWLDFPTIGFNKNWIVVQADLIPFKSSEHAIQAAYYLFDKGDLYKGGSKHTRLWRPWKEFGYTTPALTYDKTLDSLYLVRSFEADSLDVFEIQGSVGAEAIVKRATVPSSWSFSQSGPDAPQKGSAIKFKLSDDHIHNLVYRNGTLWCSQMASFPADKPTRASIQWWQFKPDGTKVQQGLLDDPTGKFFYSYPSIAVNKNGDVLIGYSRFMADEYVSANYAYRLSKDPVNQLRADILFKAGVAPYEASKPGRWGDYSSTFVDPVNDLDMWTLQQVAAKPEAMSKWSTWWKKLSFMVPDDGCKEFTFDGVVNTFAPPGPYGAIVKTAYQKRENGVTFGAAAYLGLSLDTKVSYTFKLIVACTDQAGQPVKSHVNEKMLPVEDSSQSKLALYTTLEKPKPGTYTVTGILTVTDSAGVVTVLDQGKTTTFTVK